MNYKQLEFGLLCVAIVGCAVGLPIKAVADNGISIREDRLEYPEIKLTKIFGVSDEVLADTNRFPVSSSRWYDLDLPETMGGFKTVKFTLTDDNGKFGIYDATMTKCCRQKRTIASYWKNSSPPWIWSANFLGSS